MDQKPACSSPSITPARVSSPLKKVHVVYYLSYRGGLLEQPHLLEVSLSTSRGLCLRDVKLRLASLRGRMLSSSFSWSYKRSYKEGFVWQDLESDDDLIFPTHGGCEYVMKGCSIEGSCSITQIPTTPPKMPCNSSEIVHGGSTDPYDQMGPASRVTELLTPPTAAQPGNTMSLVANDDYASKILTGSPSNAFLHGCDGNIKINLGVIEGLEQLPFTKATNLHTDYAESQASTSLNHNYYTMEQNTRSIQILKQSQEPSRFQLIPLKGSVIGRQKLHESPVFSVIKVEGEWGTSFNPSPYVGADVATQTGEDDEIADISDGNGKGEALCLPDLYRADKVPCLKSRENLYFKDTVSLRGALRELSRDEISPPPCSTSSSSRNTSTNSASNSNVITCNVDRFQKLGLNVSSSLIEDQNLRDTEISASLRNHSNEEVLLKEEEATASCMSALGSNSKARNIPTLSADTIENAFSAVGDDLSNKQKPVSNSFKVKPHVMSICNNSGRFLSLVSCGKGLEVIKPSTMPIRCNSSTRSIQAENYGEVSGSQYSSLQNFEANKSSWLDVSSPLENETATNTESHLPIGSDEVSGKLLFSADSNAAPSPPDDSGSNKKVWPLRGWLYSQCKKKRSTRSKTISNNSAETEDIYGCLDLFEKHIVNSAVGGVDIVNSAVGYANHISSKQQKSLSYDSKPRNGQMASLLQ